VQPLHKNEGVIEGENIELNCSVSISNNQIDPSPALAWLTEYGTEETTIKVEREEGVTSITLSSSYVLKANSTDGQYARCFVRLYAIPSLNDPAISRDMLKFNSLCVTEKPRMLSPANNVRIVNDTSGTMKPGDRLVCKADGVPEVRYQWLKADVAMSNVSELVLSLVAGLHHYSCQAYNVIHGMTRAEEVKISILINGSIENSSKLGGIFEHLYIIYGLLVSAAVIIVISCIIRKVRFRQKFKKRASLKSRATAQAGTETDAENNMELQPLNEEIQSFPQRPKESCSCVGAANIQENYPRNVCIYNIAEQIYLMYLN
jgi:hypothetical protein